MEYSICKDNVICCDDNCQRCANLIYNKYMEQKAEIERLQEQYKFLENNSLIFKGGIDYFKAEAIKEFEKKSEKRLIELYEKYHKIANKPRRETDMFYQGRAEAIWECIDANRYLVKEMTEKNK